MEIYDTRFPGNGYHDFRHQPESNLGYGARVMRAQLRGSRAQLLPHSYHCITSISHYNDDP